MKKYRIFLGLREVAGYMGSLQKGFSESGIKTNFLDIGGSPFCYQANANPGWLNFFNRLIGSCAKFSYRNVILRLLWLGIFQNFISVLFFLWAFLFHNVFIFCSNSTFFFFLELPILKIFRKKVIYIFLGSESRPAYCTGKVKLTEKNARLYAFLTRIQKLWIKWVEMFADCIISIPPQALLHEKPFISIMTVGYPCRFEMHPAPAPANDRVRILHSPSNRKTKGSDVLQTIIDELHAENLEFEYKEVTGVSNQRIIEEIAKSDVILDELYSDSPMAGLTTEAAALGRPSVVGSYYAGLIHNDVPADALPPSKFVLPEDIKSALRDMINDPEIRQSLGKRAADFVAEKWSCRRVAAAYLQVISGDIPENWWFSPQKIRYGCGYGLSMERLRENIRILTSACGMKSLCLKDKPEMLEFFSDLAQGKDEK